VIVQRGEVLAKVQRIFLGGVHYTR
jgi:hypothetical protein